MTKEIWKAKAKKKAKENKELKKKLKELEKSRDNWKQKAASINEELKKNS